MKQEKERHPFNTKLHEQSLKRIMRIHRMRDEGMTWQAIGDRLKVTKQRAMELGKRVIIVGGKS